MTRRTGAEPGRYPSWPHRSPSRCGPRRADVHDGQERRSTTGRIYDCIRFRSYAIVSFFTDIPEESIYEGYGDRPLRGSEVTAALLRTDWLNDYLLKQVDSARDGKSQTAPPARGSRSIGPIVVPLCPRARRSDTSDGRTR